MFRQLLSVSVVIAALAIAATVTAQAPPSPLATANVEVRVWQGISDGERLFISARPEGGRWDTLGTIPLDMSGLTEAGTYRYGDITVGVELEGVSKPVTEPAPTTTPVASDGPAPPPDPVPEPEPITVNVEVRVWQGIQDAGTLYISARPEDGDWSVLGTIPLDMSGLNSRGTYRYGDITVMVPVPGIEIATPTQEPTEDAIPWVDPRTDNTYTLRALAAMPAPAAPQLPALPEHALAVEFRVSHIDGPIVTPHLIDDATRMRVSLTHTSGSRSYAVTCTTKYPSSSRVPCVYSGQGPLNASGTRRLTLREAAGSNVEFDLVSVELDGGSSHCVEKYTNTSFRFLWWCYDSDTYIAWEEAWEAALQPATDPLERYLRNEAGPPLWYQESPYSGEGDYTTGVKLIEPYVTYESTRTPADAILSAYCLPVDSSTGQVVMDTDRSMWGIVRDEFYVTGPHLCEWEVQSEGSWTVTIQERE